MRGETLVGLGMGVSSCCSSWWLAFFDLWMRPSATSASFSKDLESLSQAPPPGILITSRLGHISKYVWTPGTAVRT